jgi:hypothetical protein
VEYVRVKGRSPTRDPGCVLIYRYFRARNARAAPTAMPRASRAISLATRWRFTYPLLSQACGGSRQGYPGPVTRSPYTFGASRSETPRPPYALGHVLFTSASFSRASPIGRTRAKKGPATGWAGPLL